MPFEVPFCRFLIFTPVIVIFPADFWTLLIDGAVSILTEEPAAVVDQQKPAILILIDLDTLMGNLPEKGLEIIFATRGVDLLGKIAAALCTDTVAALVFRRDLDLSHHLSVCSKIQSLFAAMIKSLR